MVNAVEQTALDMANARKAISFDPQRIYMTLNEGMRDGDMRREVAEVISNDPVFNKQRRPHMSRFERVQDGLVMTKRLMEICDEKDWDYMQYLEAVQACGEYLGVYLHEVAFQPVIQAQGSDEQHEEWMAKCQNHAILGCYLQTELAHGSNVQQLETTATYDPKTEEFEIHSPHLSSTKWWIGQAGVAATHGVVQAQLITGGQSRGPHLFIVQLRERDTHKLLPGLTIGDIGPKAHGGFPALDNGFIRFDRVRIPRSQMLNRFAKVHADGTYVKPPNSKLSYGGMVFIRAQMISNSGWSLSRAATIATRYAHVRRQFVDPDDPTLSHGSVKLERQVIHYASVHMRLVPVLANAYAFITVGKAMNDLYSSFASQLADGNIDLLAEVHAVSSGLKAYVTTRVVDGCEVARRSMGGHGFMESSGVGRIFASELPSVTYEGDNYVLAMQPSRAALKTYRALEKDPKLVSSLAPSSMYLARLFNASADKPLPTRWGYEAAADVLRLLGLRAGRLVQRLDALETHGKRTWQSLSWECQRVMQAIVESFICERIVEALENEDGHLHAGLGDAERTAVRTLMTFYLLFTLESALPDLLELNILPASRSVESPIESLREAVRKAALDTIPYLIGLTDAFGDYVLDSDLGRSDGRYIEALYERASSTRELNSGNPQQQEELFRKYIEPILARGERLSKM